jgi:multidrug resistance efflux pump
MTTDAPGPIPITLANRWLWLRVHVIPVLLFGAVIGVLAILWKDHVAAPTMVGQAEPVLASASCPKAGVLTNLLVSRFQKVKAGDPIATVLVVDPRVLAASLAVIQSEIELLRISMQPVVNRQRMALDYDQLRLDWMRQRARLGEARVNLQLAEAEYRRMGELFKDKIVSERVYEQAKAARDRFQGEADDLSKLVSQGESGLQDLQLTNALDLSKVTADPLVAAIAVEESKLRLTEAEMNPFTVRAPMDGIVETILHRPGEAVTAGEAIVSLASLNPARIVGYLRPPFLQEPKVGMRVSIRTRSLHPEVGKAKVVEVGTQLQTVPATLLGPVNFANIAQGLPVDISLPDALKIRSGEVVDIILGNQHD